MASSGNFPVYNILDATRRANSTLSVGNTKYTSSNSSNFLQTATFLLPETGKWYWEVRIDTFSNGGMFATALVWEDIANATSTTSFSADGFNAWLNASSNASYRINGSDDSTNHGTTAAGDVLSVAYDADTRKVWFAKNNTYNDSGDPAGGSNQAMTLTANRRYFPASANGNSAATTINFGQDSTFGGSETAGGNADGNGFGDFAYSPPTGFLALCSANLPTSDDIDPAQTDTDFPSKQFNVLTYSGNGSTQNITGLGFQPDLCWIKDRTSTAAYGNCLIDSTRGRAKVLYSHDTRAQLTSGTSEDLTSFDSDGFSLANSANAAVNTNGQNYVAWCWKANGGTTTTNTQGAASNTLQANTKAGFSISQFSNSSGATTIGHGLGVAPAFYVIKIADGGGGSWGVYHKSLGATKYVRFNSNAAAATASNYFNDTEPTSTVLSVGSTWTGTTIMCYAWADVEGFQKFGKYTANGNADGPFVYTGFRPRLLAIKGIDTTNSWMVFDTARETANPIDQNLHWDSSAGEATEDYRDLDILSNGFKIRSDNGALGHPSGDEYIYCAWGDVPFKYNNTF
jgi:hypothetical protein